MVSARGKGESGGPRASRERAPFPPGPRKENASGLPVAAAGTGPERRCLTDVSFSDARRLVGSRHGQLVPAGGLSGPSPVGVGRVRSYSRWRRTAAHGKIIAHRCRNLSLSSGVSRPGAADPTITDDTGAACSQASAGLGHVRRGSLARAPPYPTAHCARWIPDATTWPANRPPVRAKVPALPTASTRPRHGL